MPLRIISFFRELVRSFRINSEDESSLSVELDRELEDLRKFSLTLLMAFLTVHEISASNALGATTLGLLVYTINLHVAINIHFLRNSPTLSRFLHAIPLFGIFCMAIFKLVIVVRSPVITAAVLLACALPPLVIAVHPTRQYLEMMLMRDAAHVLPGPTDTPVVSS